MKRGGGWIFGYHDVGIFKRHRGISRVRNKSGEKRGVMKKINGAGRSLEKGSRYTLLIEEIEVENTIKLLAGVVKEVEQSTLSPRAIPWMRRSKVNGR